MAGRMPSERAIAITAVVLVAAFALSAFLLPVFGDREAPGEREEVFLGQDKVMTVRYRDWDSAHMLGEKFNITFVIQYDDARIKPDIESLGSASFEPFDLLDTVIYHRKVEDGVYEYIYRVELVAINAITGKEYVLNPVILKYEVISTGKIEAADIAPTMPLQIGSYYGDNLNGAFLRPAKTMFSSNLIAKSILFAVSALLAFVSLVLLLRVWKEAPKPKIIRERVPSESIASMLAHFERKGWDNLDLKELRARMRELEALALRLATDEFGIESPRDFWMNRDPVWEKLVNLLKLSYNKDGPHAESIDSAVKSFKQVLDHVHKKEGR
ncbi:MAG: hypothetical protein A2919_00810 [Candidatus Spechtbacteria bacterium RIFCSPLOWO2_01_FULL_43_12]|uniref:Uncharacterized protein n=1 Tax=Candidatus Spechtbacteria bacterium RIFCSPLOWO2_01_FULL_43_12 TaxID=1802162 RepID=A0A1G2HEX6_9BACT|nr:MAG: hypothetical protein A2919_00810 [Candidatus Spechtbacteria bacterium RIFCSPLOWO2_01_FULL_43_12]